LSNFSRFPQEEAHETIIGLLKYFEIIYQMRVGGSVTSEDKLHEEQMFFVPSLLFLVKEAYADHPSYQYWQQIEPKYGRVRDLLAFFPLISSFPPSGVC